ncbi:HIT family protein [Gammaproteobacteria bacterium 45_16_T64]|nr:HIT family protein [Gammaproteobacteria bacterium 45_16_T64]
MGCACIFCEIIEGRVPVSKVYEDDAVLAFMDLYPMRPGHVLVIPKKHHLSVLTLDQCLRSHIFEVAVRVAKAQMEVGLSCVAHNFFINDGPDANQHVPHVHLHVLPRTGGDLYKAMLSFTSRFNNVFGKAAKRKKLDSLATKIGEKMPLDVDAQKEEQ